MSTLRKKVPVVTYTLLPVFQRKLKNKEVSKKARAKALEDEAMLLKTKRENEKRLAEKKALRAEIRATHVIPAFVLEERRAKKEAQKKIREFAMVECRRQKKLAEDLLREQENWAGRMKQFRKELRRMKIVPLEAKKIPQMFQADRIGQAELLECEAPLVPVFTRLAKIVGFDVETDEWEENIALILWKPYPYWRYAFSDEKRSIS